MKDNFKLVIKVLRDLYTDLFAVDFASYLLKSRFCTNILFNH